MQAVDGPNSSQLEWHQDGVKTNGPNSSQLEWHQDGVKTNSDDYCVNCGLNSGVRSVSRQIPIKSSRMEATTFMILRAVY
jgi:hypothetical protein